MLQWLFDGRGVIEDSRWQHIDITLGFPVAPYDEKSGTW